MSDFNYTTIDESNLLEFLSDPSFVVGSNYQADFRTPSKDLSLFTAFDQNLDVSSDKTYQKTTSAENICISMDVSVKENIYVNMPPLKPPTSAQYLRNVTSPIEELKYPIQNIGLERTFLHPDEQAELFGHEEYSFAPSQQSTNELNAVDTPHSTEPRANINARRYRRKCNERNREIEGKLQVMEKAKESYLRKISIQEKLLSMLKIYALELELTNVVKIKLFKYINT